jgi:hypothetical protein
VSMPAAETAALLRHLGTLTDDVGLFEHASGAEPRRDVGYCSDDAGRALAVVCALDAREADELALRCVAFLERAALGGGHFRLRLHADGVWRGRSDDASARAILGVATASVAARVPEVRERAAALFADCGAFTSPYPRATAYAALGAAEVLRRGTGDVAGSLLAEAGCLVAEAARSLPRGSDDGVWPWPESRLSYANPLLPHTLAAVGEVLGDAETERAGRSLLDWLVAHETLGDHFSFTPVGGAGPGAVKPAFDQQPIEAWAMADACAHALALTGEAKWCRAGELAVEWFLGANDGGVVMFDAKSGGGYDGLTASGANPNQGAESTLAFVASRLLAGAFYATRSSSSRSGTEATAAPTHRSAAP